MKSYKRHSNVGFEIVCIVILNFLFSLFILPNLMYIADTHISFMICTYPTLIQSRFFHSMDVLRLLSFVSLLMLKYSRFSCKSRSVSLCLQRSSKFGDEEQEAFMSSGHVAVCFLVSAHVFNCCIKALMAKFY